MAKKNGDPPKKKGSSGTSLSFEMSDKTKKRTSAAASPKSPKTKGSCESGNLRACKSTPSKTKPFSASKKQHNVKLVKSKPAKKSKPTPAQKKSAQSNRPSNPRFL